jgi:hypothetical protein
MSSERIVTRKSLGAVGVLPLCAVCHTRVERLVERYDDFMQRMTWIVECHGRTERVDLSEADLRTALVAMGVAFQHEVVRAELRP